MFSNVLCEYCLTYITPGSPPQCATKQNMFHWLPMFFGFVIIHGGLEWDLMYYAVRARAGPSEHSQLGDLSITWLWKNFNVWVFHKTSFPKTPRFEYELVWFLVLVFEPRKGRHTRASAKLFRSHNNLIEWYLKTEIYGVCFSEKGVSIEPIPTRSAAALRHSDDLATLRHIFKSAENEPETSKCVWLPNLAQKRTLTPILKWNQKLVRWFGPNTKKCNFLPTALPVGKRHFFTMKMAISLHYREPLSLKLACDFLMMY